MPSRCFDSTQPPSDPRHGATVADAQIFSNLWYGGISVPQRTVMSSTNVDASPGIRYGDGSARGAPLWRPVCRDKRVIQAVVIGIPLNTRLSFLIHLLRQDVGQREGGAADAGTREGVDTLNTYTDLFDEDLDGVAKPSGRGDWSLLQTHSGQLRKPDLRQPP